MNKFVYSGTVLYRNGKRMPVALKRGSKHWIDTDRNRWRFKDGRAATTGEDFPRLMLGSINTPPGAGASYAHRLTHVGSVVMFARRVGGVGRLTRIRQTKLYWIDELGTMFRKSDGFSTPDAKWRLKLDTVQIIPVVRAMPQPVCAKDLK